MRRFLCTSGLSGLKTLACSTTHQKGTNVSNTFIRHVRSYARARSSKVVSPVGKLDTSKAPELGRIFLGGACAAGIGAMCFYGLGLSNEVGAIDTARFWPNEMRSRIKSTYTYFASGLGITAGSAFYFSRSPTVIRMMNGNKWVVFGGSLVAMIGSSIACRSIEYQPGFNAKHAAWAVHSGVIGLVIAPIMLMGGPLVVRAAAYTAGAVGALSLTAASAPNGKFLTWSGPLSLALGGICIASIGGMFLPATSAALPVIYSLSTYGGLVIFGGFMLYDTQKIISLAERSHRFDPINASLGIYMDTINIFIRIMFILSGNRRK